MPPGRRDCGQICGVQHSGGSSPHDADSVHGRPRPAVARRSAARIAQWLGRCCLARSQRLARILGCIDIWLFQLAQALFFFLLLFGQVPLPFLKLIVWLHFWLL